MSALRTVSVIAAGFILAACATTDDRAARIGPQTPDAGIDTDHEYVAQVESIALRRGIDVQWVNMPTKRPARDDD